MSRKGFSEEARFKQRFEINEDSAGRRRGREAPATVCIQGQSKGEVAAGAPGPPEDGTGCTELLTEHDRDPESPEGWEADHPVASRGRSARVGILEGSLGLQDGEGNLGGRGRRAGRAVPPSQ